MSAAWTSESTAPAFRVESHLEKVGPVGPGLQAEAAVRAEAPDKAPLYFLFISLRGHPWASQEVEVAECCF